MAGPNPHFDELGRRGIELGRRDYLVNLQGGQDRELVERLREVKDTMHPLELVLGPKQTAALTAFFWEIVGTMDELDEEERKSLLAGMRWGFGLGHYFVARYGPLVESEEEEGK